LRGKHGFQKKEKPGIPLICGKEKHALLPSIELMQSMTSEKKQKEERMSRPFRQGEMKRRNPRFAKKKS